MFVKIKADIRHWLRELDKKYFCVMLGFAVMVYFPLISLKLTNTVDGLWTTAEYMAGAWELSNGRWFWLVTSFLRFSLQLEPINAVVCLVLVSLGVTRLHMLFKPAWMRTSCIDWLAGLCYVSNVVVGCYLSFHFIAPEYGFSFFFAMLATEHVIRGKSAVSSIVPAAVLLALSLGLYQTNLACFCLVLLAYFLLLLFQNGEKQKIREYICKSLASAASGAVLYLLILKITLWATGTAMADYQGGADISVSGILKNLPSSVEKCYELFYRYFFGTLVKHNMLQETAVVFALIFCVVGAALACRLVRLIRRKDWENTFYGTAALLVLHKSIDCRCMMDGQPVNVFLMIASPEDGTVHMDIMAMLAMALNRPGVHQGLLEAASPEQAENLLARESGAAEEDAPKSARPAKILVVTACPTGIAHTYIAAQSFRTAAREMDLPVRIETDGSRGVDGEFTPEEIQQAKQLDLLTYGTTGSI